MWREQQLGSALELNVNVCALMFRHLCLESLPDGLNASCASPRADEKLPQGGAEQEKSRALVHFVSVW